MQFGELKVDEAEGAVLAHGAVGRDGVLFRKGRVLSAGDIAVLVQNGISHVTAVRLGPDDVDENAAALELAHAVGGSHLRVADAFTGRVNLYAEAHGLLVIDTAMVDRVNETDESITVATLPDHAQVSPGQMAVTVKIIPFATSRRMLDACLERVGSRPPIRVAPFRPLRARLVQTRLAGTSDKMLDKTVAVTTQRLEALGGTLLEERRCSHDAAALATELDRTGEADLILVAGASAITDRGDVLPAGIESAGGEVLHFGMPVDPGNLILLARLRGRAVLGLPGCARSPKLNGFDWVLQRMAAGLEVTPKDIMRMGVGGLLMEIPTRPQPREKIAGKPAGPRIAAIVLAAGQSRRMLGPNKLLAPIDGKPMVRRVVEAALAGRLSPVIVVTGHMKSEVESALGGMPVRFVENPTVCRRIEHIGARRFRRAAGGGRRGSRAAGGHAARHRSSRSRSSRRRLQSRGGPLDRRTYSPGKAWKSGTLGQVAVRRDEGACRRRGSQMADRPARRDRGRGRDAGRRLATGYRYARGACRCDRMRRMSVDTAALRAQFPIFSNIEPPFHYLDNAATGQICAAAAEALLRFETTMRANVKRGVYRLADAATSAFAEARAAVASYINAAAADEVVFTSGTTLAINTVAHALRLAPGGRATRS